MLRLRLEDAHGQLAVHVFKRRGPLLDEPVLIQPRQPIDARPALVAAPVSRAQVHPIRQPATAPAKQHLPVQQAAVSSTPHQPWLPMLWFALILPEPALQAIQRGSPDAAPLALVERHPRARVVAANAAARQLGITAGDSLAGALAVAPALELLDHDPRRSPATAHRSRHLGQRLHARDQHRPTRLRAARSGRQPATLWRPAATHRPHHPGLAELGLDARLACAPTPLAARWLARHRPGSAITETGALAQPLGALPLAALADGSDVSCAAIELLGSIGVARLAEVAEAAARAASPDARQPP